MVEMETLQCNIRVHMKIILIAAIGRNRELGKSNELIWKLPDDLYRFSVMTRDKIVVMGRKTLESIPGPLARRDMLVLTTQPVVNFHNEKGVVKAVNSVEEVIEYAKSKFAEEVYIIGGAQIYKEFLPLADELDLTLIDAEDSEADAFFPEFEDKWYCRQTVVMRDEKQSINYTFTRWVLKD